VCTCVRVCTCVAALARTLEPNYTKCTRTFSLRGHRARSRKFDLRLIIITCTSFTHELSSEKIMCALCVLVCLAAEVICPKEEVQFS